jgi:hypothetical protein
MNNQLRINTLPNSDFELICHYVDALKKNKKKTSAVKAQIRKYLIQFSKAIQYSHDAETMRIIRQLKFTLACIKSEINSISDSSNPVTKKNCELLHSNSLIIEYNTTTIDYSSIGSIHESMIRSICYGIIGLEAVSYLHREGYYLYDQYWRHLKSIAQTVQFLSESLKFLQDSSLDVTPIDSVNLRDANGSSFTNQQKIESITELDEIDPSIFDAYNDFTN